MKTNKSFSHRLKVTKKGKVLGRKAGLNHFNAKASRKSQLNKKHKIPFMLNTKQVGQYMGQMGNN